MVDLRRGKKTSGGPTFSEVVGQQELKQALLAVAVNEELDGLLIRGEKGTAKSTAVRGLAELLPGQAAVADCPYGCPPDDPARQCETCRERSDPPIESRRVPLVTVPLGATRDRVVGTLSVSDALGGDHEFDPGLLARANRGILYVDEVNLLEDHLVDVLLDAAADGHNRVERDGVSRTHPAEFTLIGTMNPEEGQLRPQLRDRFALQATVTGCSAIEDRVAIIEQSLRDGRGRSELEATDRASPTDDSIRDRITDARGLLDRVALPREFAEEIATLCRDAGIDGHRGDIAIARAARTFAALGSRTKVIENDLERAAELALPHRLTSRPFEEAPDTDEVIDDAFEDGDEQEEGTEDGDAETDDRADRADSEDGDPESGEGDDPESSDDSQRGDDQTGSDSTDSEDGGRDSGSGEAGETEEEGGSDPSRDGDHTPDSGEADEDSEDASPLVVGQSRTAVPEVGESRAPEMDLSEESLTGETSGGRMGGPESDGRGARIRTEPASGRTGVDAAASIRAAAREGRTDIGSRDLRQSVRTGDGSALVVFVVDASASMRPAMRAAKGTGLDLLKDAYQQRDEVAFVAFAGDEAEVLLPPTDSVTLAARHLKELPTGDRTPLPAGLDAAADVLERADPATGLAVLVTDGKTNVGSSPVDATREAATRLAAVASDVIVVDAGTGGRTGLVETIVDVSDGRRVPLDALSAERIDAAVGDSTTQH